MYIFNNVQFMLRHLSYFDLVEVLLQLAWNQKTPNRTRTNFEKKRANAHLFQSNLALAL